MLALCHWFCEIKKQHRPGNDLMSVRSVGTAKRFGQTKISQLQHSATVQQQIIGLQILDIQSTKICITDCKWSQYNKVTSTYSDTHTVSICWDLIFYNRRAIRVQCLAQGHFGRLEKLRAAPLSSWLVDDSTSWAKAGALWPVLTFSMCCLRIKLGFRVRIRIMLWKGWVRHLVLMV